MSERAKNNTMVALGIITCIFTIGGNLLVVGSLKGELVTTLAQHTKLLDQHELKLEKTSIDMADLKARIHGVASQVGKVPGQVIAKLQEER